jgi:SAM-dependent methyltransferase
VSTAAAERLIEHYDRKYAGRLGAAQAIPATRHPSDRHQAAVKWAGAGRRALEIGAGSGAVLAALRRSYPQCVGTELSTHRAAVLQERFRCDPAVRILRHDIEREGLPFPEAYFDTAVMIAVVEHLLDPVPALAEVRRVIRPGGRLVIETPNIAKWTRRLKLCLGVFPATASRDEGLLMYDGKTPTDLYDEGHLHYFTFRSLARILRERVGFAQVRRLGYGPLGPLCQLWPALFSDVFLIAVK